MSGLIDAKCWSAHDEVVTDIVMVTVVAKHSNHVEIKCNNERKFSVRLVQAGPDEVGWDFAAGAWRE